MNAYLSRWTFALAWAALMLIVWALFVPRGVSVTTFFLLGATGLAVLFVGPALISNSQPPRSVNQILVELEAPPATARRTDGRS